MATVKDASNLADDLNAAVLTVQQVMSTAKKFPSVNRDFLARLENSFVPQLEEIRDKVAVVGRARRPGFFDTPENAAVDVPTLSATRRLGG